MRWEGPWELDRLRIEDATLQSGESEKTVVLLLASKEEDTGLGIKSMSLLLNILSL